MEQPETERPLAVDIGLHGVRGAGGDRRRVRVIDETPERIFVSVVRATPLIVSAALGLAVFRELARCGGLLLHSALVESRGTASLFVGKSGSGKSTVSRNATGATCVHDDRAALRRENGIWYAYGTPLVQNEGAPGLPLRLPLRGIFLLSKGKRTKVTRLAARDALSSLTENTILASTGPELVDNTFHALLRLIGDVPCSRLRFHKQTDVTDLLP